MSWVYFMVLSIVTAADINLQPDPDDANPESRVFNGTPILIEEAPYYALLLVAWGFGNIPDSTCGGTIYNEQHILTAAHCVYNSTAKRPADRVTVFVGKADLLANSGHDVVFVAVTVIAHPSFNSPSLHYNDIAVLRLPGCITYSAYMQPLSVTTVDPGLLRGPCTWSITGFGETEKKFQDETGNPTNRLRKGEVTYVAKAACEGFYQLANANLASVYSPSYILANPTMIIPLFPIHPSTTFCATTVPQGGCTGDSGGGFICDYQRRRIKELCGIVTAGIGCGLGIPELITDVWQFRGWIRTTITTGAGLLNCPNGWDLSRPSTRRPTRSRDLPDMNPEGGSSFNQSSSPTCHCMCKGSQ